MSLTLYLLPPSPNNTKVQVALAYKGIEHESVVIDPQDPSGRACVVEATGQPLTPAIVHDGVRLFDSSAILRYLDANFPGPRLFAPDRESMKAIEGWERSALFGIGPWLSRAFGLFFTGADDAEEAAAIAAGIHAATAELEQALEGRTWLVGDAMTAADITVGCLLAFACHTEQQAGHNPVWGFFHGAFQLGDDRARCRAHAQRVLAYLPDQVQGGR